MQMGASSLPDFFGFTGPTPRTPTPASKSQATGKDSAKPS